jgi:hypothetical protein
MNLQPMVTQGGNMGKHLDALRPTQRDALEWHAQVEEIHHPNDPTFTVANREQRMEATAQDAAAVEKITADHICSLPSRRRKTITPGHSSSVPEKPSDRDSWGR